MKKTARQNAEIRSKVKAKLEESKPLAWVLALVTGTILFILAATQVSYAKTYPLPPEGNNVVGEIFAIKARGGETVSSIARRYNVGLDDIRNANPHIRSRYVPGGTKVVVPALYILPDKPWRGVIVNLPEKRMYYFPPGRRVVETYPVGIGRLGDETSTPLMSTQIIEKKANPEWRPPESVKAEAAANGIMLPDVMPPGPKNPLGDYMMRLGAPSYLIHGTNRPSGVGSRVSSGCIRMFPEDVEQLFSKVNVGTPVKIIHQAYRAGWGNNVLYFEAHEPLEEHAFNYTRRTVMEAIADELTRPPYDIDWQKARRVARARNGIPYPVGYRHWQTAKKVKQLQEKMAATA